MKYLELLRKRIAEAGASDEDSYDRNGAFSYHAETHAAGMGVALGFGAGATGTWKLLGALFGIAVYGTRGETKLEAKIVDDIKQEPHYALGGAVVGVALGVTVQLFTASGSTGAI